MTNYEKWSLRASWLALFISIATPFVMHYFFNPLDQELEYSGKLNVTEHFLFHDHEKTGYEIEIINIGKKPVGDICISAFTADDRIELPNDKSNILIIPISPFEYIRESKYLTIKPERNLAHDEKLTIHISGLHIPEKVYSSDFIVSVGSATGGALRINSYRGTGAGGDY